MQKRRKRPSAAKKKKRDHVVPATKVNRKRMSVCTLDTPTDDVEYWRSRSPAERLRHVEFLRLINYGQAAVSGRLKRVFEIAQLEES
jgi:hypothetical protein